MILTLSMLLFLMVPATQAQNPSWEQWQRQREATKLNERIAVIEKGIGEDRVVMENRITKIESSQRIAEWAITGLITAAIGMVGNIVRERLTKAKS